MVVVASFEFGLTAADVVLRRVGGGCDCGLVYNGFDTAFSLEGAVIWISTVAGEVFLTVAI